MTAWPEESRETDRLGCDAALLPVQRCRLHGSYLDADGGCVRCGKQFGDQFYGQADTSAAALLQIESD